MRKVRALYKTSLVSCLTLLAGAASASVWSEWGAGAPEDPSPFLVQLPPAPSAQATADAEQAGWATTSGAPLPGDDPAPPKLPVGDLAYFGAGWQIIELKSSSPAFALGGGYQNARVTRDPDGTFFAGLVEKADASGRITDVVIAFSGTQGAGDLDPAVGLILTASSPQLLQAQAMLDAAMADPRYADANIHLTGHSLGGAIATWLFGYSLDRYGVPVTHARISATIFATPPWGNAVQAHFGLTAADFGNHVQNYVAANDIVQPLGGWALGVQHVLEPYEPFDLLAPVNGIINLSIGHAPIAVVLGLGTPTWLTPAQREAALTAVSIGLNVGDPSSPLQNIWDRDYGADGTVARTITGTAAADTVFGSDSGDVITGGGGADRLVGGTGGDRFVYLASDATASAPDLIADFAGNQGDRIDLRQIPVAGLLPLGRFRFVGNSAPSASNEVGYSWSGDYTVVTAKLGGGRPELVIRLKGRQYLGASSFFL